MNDDGQYYLAYQPILDRQQQGVGFELLFRGGRRAVADVTDDVCASASVITQAFSHFGMQGILGRQRGFINVSKELLLSDSIELLPRDKVVLELLETMAVDAAVVRRCQELKEMGFTLALDDFVFSDAYLPLLPLADIVKVDVLQLDSQAIAETLEWLRPWPALKLLAEKVETPEDFEFCCQQGFHWFQGYYFARPALFGSRRIDPEQTALFKLLQQINANAAPAALEATFQHYPGLSLKLLRLVNSVALSRYPIDSIRDALRILGMRKLEQWLQLLLYAGNGEQQPGELMRLAARRGKLMEILAGESASGTAFMVGILSLADVLLGMEMHEILQQIHVSPEIQAALLHRQGRLGRFLHLAQALEDGDFLQSRALGDQAGINAQQLIDAQLTAAGWADSLAVA